MGHSLRLAGHRFARQPEHAFGENILENFVGAAADALPRDREQELCPRPGAPLPGVRDDARAEDTRGKLDSAP